MTDDLIEVVFTSEDRQIKFGQIEYNVVSNLSSNLRASVCEGSRAFILILVEDQLTSFHDYSNAPSDIFWGTLLQ